MEEEVMFTVIVIDDEHPLRAIVYRALDVDLDPEGNCSENGTAQLLVDLDPSTDMRKV